MNSSEWSRLLEEICCVCLKAACKAALVGGAIATVAVGSLWYLASQTQVYSK